MASPKLSGLCADPHCRSAAGRGAASLLRPRGRAAKRCARPPAAAAPWIKLFHSATTRDPTAEASSSRGEHPKCCECECRDSPRRQAKDLQGARRAPRPAASRACWEWSEPGNASREPRPGRAWKQIWRTTNATMTASSSSRRDGPADWRPLLWVPLLGPWQFYWSSAAHMLTRLVRGPEGFAQRKSVFVFGKVRSFVVDDGPIPVRI